MNYIFSAPKLKKRRKETNDSFVIMRLRFTLVFLDLCYFTILYECLVLWPFPPSSSKKLLNILSVSVYSFISFKVPYQVSFVPHFMRLKFALEQYSINIKNYLAQFQSHFSRTVSPNFVSMFILNNCLLVLPSSSFNITQVSTLFESKILSLARIHR